MESTSTDGTNSCKMSFKRIPDIMVRETDILGLGQKIMVREGGKENTQISLEIPVITNNVLQSHC